MRALNQIRFLLGVVAVLLFLILVSGGTDSDSNLSLVRSLNAQTAPAGADVLFFPVGNQDVRKFVFWDRRANQIHIYNGGGKFEETWQVGALGQDMKKQ